MLRKDLKGWFYISAIAFEQQKLDLKRKFWEFRSQIRTFLTQTGWNSTVKFNRIRIQGPNSFKFEFKFSLELRLFTYFFFFLLYVLCFMSNSKFVRVLYCLVLSRKTFLIHKCFLMIFLRWNFIQSAKMSRF